MKKIPKKQDFTVALVFACFMIALVTSLMVPTSIAWFTSSTTSSGETTINFGTLKVGIDSPVALEQGGTVVNSKSEKTFTDVLGGDTITLQVELFNSGTANMYVMPKIDIEFYYNIETADGTAKTDITRLMANYFEISNETSATALSDSNDSVFELTTDMVSGNGLTFNGFIDINEDLGNSVTDGSNVYELNSNTANVSIVFNIYVGVVRADQYTQTEDIVSDLSALLNSSQSQ